MRESIRVAVDANLMRQLQESYMKDNWLPKLVNVSHETLLHVAAVCVAEASIKLNEDDESYRCEKRAEAAIDAVRQLAVVYEKMLVIGSMREDAGIVIEGKSQ